MPKLNKKKGISGVVYDAAPETPAHRKSAYDSPNWIRSGRSVEECVAFLLKYADNQMIAELKTWLSLADTSKNTATPQAGQLATLPKSA